MAHFCNQINVFLASDVEKVSGRIITPKTGKTFYPFSTDDFTLEPDSSVSLASLLNRISKTIYTDKVSAEQQSIFSCQRSVIVEFITDQKKTVIIGSLRYPAKLIYTPTLKTGILKLEWKTPEPIKF